MLVAGITSILVCKMILQYGPDLGAITDDPLTKFLNSITGIFFIGGVFTLYMTVPFLVRTFWKDKGGFVIVFVIMLAISWPLTMMTLWIPWGRLVEAVM